MVIIIRKNISVHVNKPNTFKSNVKLTFNGNGVLP